VSQSETLFCEVVHKRVYLSLWCVFPAGHSPSGWKWRPIAYRGTCSTGPICTSWPVDSQGTEPKNLRLVHALTKCSQKDYISKFVQQESRAFCPPKTVCTKTQQCPIQSEWNRIKEAGGIYTRNGCFVLAVVVLLGDKPWSAIVSCSSLFSSSVSMEARCMPW